MKTLGTDHNLRSLLKKIQYVQVRFTQQTDTYNSKLFKFPTEKCQLVLIF